MDVDTYNNFLLSYVHKMTYTNAVTTKNTILFYLSTSSTTILHLVKSVYRQQQKLPIQSLLLLLTVEQCWDDLAILIHGLRCRFIDAMDFYRY